VKPVAHRVFVVAATKKTREALIKYYIDHVHKRYLGAFRFYHIYRAYNARHAKNAINTPGAEVPHLIMFCASGVTALDREKLHQFLINIHSTATLILVPDSLLGLDRAV